MRAVVVHGAGDLRVEERPEPVAGPGEVVLDLEWGGICGSDLSYYRHGATGTAVVRAPLVLGHEVAGRVRSLGPGVTGVEVGLPVTVHPATPVGDLALPDRIAGRTNLHREVRYLGSAALLPHTDGAFAEQKTVRVDQLRPLPAGVDTLHGALAEPLGVAMHAVRRAGEVRGRDVLVNGAGPIGALVVAALRFAGARTVTAADVSPAALGIARALGADVCVDVGAGEDLPGDVELVIEASGSPGALGAVLHAVARGGTLVQVGNLPGAPTPAALGDLVTREITWVGSYRFVDEISDAVAALAAGLDVSPLITHRFPLADAAEALRVAADRSTGSSKVMLQLA
ncbi:L-idonate 5-dehydrogenase [Friedmanniella luteola]|uniref:L-idonate 5-dehydrogenase n=1 Tax=Friedmanniella luteola TaxID=546871 RepID=A0A1H2A8M4_9ACTN|nr:L-idonate 5-dehydrogenase [Friedmanniella luteola]SDT42122.1 L-idonate 5-dehydrogenase [Friedmanniella luteola]